MTPTPIAAASGILLDTNTKLSASEAHALRVCGVASVVRYWPLPGNSPAGDLDATELAAIHGEQIVVVGVQHPREPKYNKLTAAMGAADATHMLEYAKNVGYEGPVTFAIDIEGVQPWSDSPGYTESATETILTAGSRTLIYIGYSPLLTAANLETLARMGDVEFWSDFENLDLHPTPPQGWALHQQPQTTFAGIAIDRDVVLRDNVVYGMGP